jgi:hypothetical protein
MPWSGLWNGAYSIATLAPTSAIGVEEIQFAKGHKYLTLVYQIDAGAARLLWVGKEPTVEAFQGFFTMLGEELASKIQFVCSDTYFVSGAHFRSPCCSLRWAPVGSIPLRSRRTFPTR